MSKKNAKVNIVIFLFVLYFATLPFKHLIYISSALIPISLVGSIVALSIHQNGKIPIGSGENKKTQSLWIIAILIIFFNNFSIKTELISGGIIQYIVLILFIYFIKYYNITWIEYMYKLMYAFFLLHAVATVCFAFFPGMYSNFCRVVYPSIQNWLINCNSNGKIPGLCSHYSTNGSYLAMGLGFSFINLVGKSNKKLYSLLSFLLIAVAILMCGKRGHLVFAIFSCLVIYIIYNPENIIFKSMKIIIFFVTSLLIFYISIQYIPSLNNTFSRFVELEYDSSGGRDILFELAINMFKKSPLIGCGWGSYKYYANSSEIGAIYGRNSRQHRIISQ